MFLSDGQSMTEIEAMMRQLFSEHKAEMKHTIESIITRQLQPLNHAITQKRIERGSEKDTKFNLMSDNLFAKLTRRSIELIVFLTNTRHESCTLSA